MLRIHNGSQHETLNLLDEVLGKCLHFVITLHRTTNKKRITNFRVCSME